MTTPSSSSNITSPLTLRGMTVPNRVVVPPMCMWVAEPGSGIANEQHLVHYGSLAESGVGLIIVEATSVEPRSYISPNDLGLWEDSQIAAMQRLTKFVHDNTTSKIAVQLNHAGPKSMIADFNVAAPKQLSVDHPLGGELYAASAVAFGPFRTPKELTVEQIQHVKASFVKAARRAVSAGFDSVEIHCAHGFLLHTFYSPVTNQRTDNYGGSFENRVRLALEVAEEVRKAIPDSMPLLYRISCSDWVDGGWTIDDSVELCKLLKAKGVDLIDCSSGGASPMQDIQAGFLYQVPFAEAIRSKSGIPTIAVGGVKTWEEACSILDENRADLVAVGRANLKDAYWYRQGVLSTGTIPWHPPRQMMGFMASQRKQAREKAAKEQAQEQTSGATTSVAN